MTEQEELRQNLNILDTSLVFLLLLVLAVLLSLWGVLVQRKQTCLRAVGKEPNDLPSVISIRRVAATITVGCLGFFFSLALDVLEETAKSSDFSVKRSAQVNTIASLLVFLAAVLRLTDLQTTVSKEQNVLLDDTTLPD